MLLPYQRLLHGRDMLRLKCTRGAVLWNTEALGALRKALHAALRPGWQLGEAYAARRAALATAMGVQPDAPDPLPYLAVHLPDEQDWHDWCLLESLREPEESQVVPFK